MKKLLLIMVIAVSSLFAQAPSKVADTIKTVALKPFKVPGKSNLVLTNVLRVSFNAEILDANGNKIRDAENGSQFPDNAKLAKMVTGGRGATVQYWLNETIPNPGTYFVKIGINLRSEVGRQNVDVYYAVVVDYPTMAAVINIHKRYLFTEKTQFSFATLEYTDPQLYTYEIQESNGTPIESGTGPIVDLTKAFSLERNVGATIRVVGKYNGKEFQYKEVGGGVKSSTWEFNLEAPAISYFKAWLDKEQADKGKDRNIYYLNDFAMQILVACMDKNEEGSFIAVQPKIKNLRITSNPPLIKNQATARPSGVFSIVYLQPDEDWILNNMDEYSSQYVEITIQFSDQFNRPQKKVFAATIIN